MNPNTWTDAQKQRLRNRILQEMLEYGCVDMGRVADACGRSTISCRRMARILNILYVPRVKIANPYAEYTPQGHVELPLHKNGRRVDYR